MNDILEKYYQLIIKDRKYLKEYVLDKHTENKHYDLLAKQIEEYFIWRKIKNYEDLENIAKGNKARELLKFNNYYSDEMDELLAQYLKVDFAELTDEEFDSIFSEDNLQKIVENEKAPKQLKECIVIERESRTICNEMCVFIEQNINMEKECEK